jgi:hypothetical protein
MVGALFMKLFGITSTNFSNLSALLFTCNMLSLLPLPLVKWVPDETAAAAAAAAAALAEEQGQQPGAAAAAAAKGHGDHEVLLSIRSRSPLRSRDSSGSSAHSGGSLGARSKLQGASERSQHGRSGADLA